MPLSLRYTSVVSLFGLLFVLNSCRHHLEGDGTQNTSIDLEKGTARIILVGDGTSGSCEITLSDISNVSVDSPSDGLDSEEWMDDFYND